MNEIQLQVLSRVAGARINSKGSSPCYWLPALWLFCLFSSM